MTQLLTREVRKALRTALRQGVPEGPGAKVRFIEHKDWSDEYYGQRYAHIKILSNAPTYRSVRYNGNPIFDATFKIASEWAKSCEELEGDIRIEIEWGGKDARRTLPTVQILKMIDEYNLHNKPAIIVASKNRQDKWLARFVFAFEMPEANILRIKTFG